MAITRDGTRLVYLVRGESGNQLVVRALDRLETTVLTGPGETVRDLFVSPDGMWVGYVDGEGGLRKVSILGGPSVLLATVRGPTRGGSWGADGTIVWSVSGGLLRVPEDGGEPVELTRPEGVEHWWPEILPGEKAVLYTLVAGDNESFQIAMLSLATGETKVLVPGGTSPRYVATGHIVYGVGGTLRAVGFDLERLEVTGNPVPVLEGVVTKSSGAADFAIARDGSLVYLEGDPVRAFERTLVWVDRSGQKEALAAPPRAYFYPRLSPDGRRLALDVRDQENDVWVWDFARETLTRLTFDPHPDQYPSWTPDGLRVAFGSGSPNNFFWRASDGTGSVERLTESANSQLPHGFSPDGRFLVYREERPESGIDLGLLSLEDGKFSPLLATAFTERNGEISPEGRFLAYESNESGRLEVYVRPFPDVDSGRWQVSRDGGGRPLWARNGRELFYMDLAGQILAVPVETEPSFAFGNAAVVVEAGYFAGPPAGRTCDVSSDAERFLMIQEGDAIGKAELIYVQNWTEELKRLVPSGN